RLLVCLMQAVVAKLLAEEIGLRCDGRDTLGRRHEPNLSCLRELSEKEFEELRLQVAVEIVYAMPDQAERASHLQIGSVRSVRLEQLRFPVNRNAFHGRQQRV